MLNIVQIWKYPSTTIPTKYLSKISLLEQPSKPYLMVSVLTLGVCLEPLQEPYRSS